MLNSLINNFLPVRNLSNSEFSNFTATSKSFCKSLELQLNIQDNYDIIFKSGNGRRADCPWIYFKYKHTSKDISPNSGIYPCILINPYGDGFSLSIQKGVDSPNPLESINNLRSKVNYIKGKFNNSDLAIITPSKLFDLPKSSRPAKYEKSNILGLEYSLYNQDVLYDLKILLHIYENIIL